MLTSTPVINCQSRKERVQEYINKLCKGVNGGVLKSHGGTQENKIRHVLYLSKNAVTPFNSLELVIYLLVKKRKELMSTVS